MLRGSGYVSPQHLNTRTYDSNEREQYQDQSVTNAIGGSTGPSTVLHATGVRKGIIRVDSKIDSLLKA
jgi:hypothetical protein